MISVNSDLNYSNSEPVSVREAALRENVTEKTIYNRINRGYYRTHQEGEKTFVWVRKSSVHSQSPTELTAPVVQNVSEPSSASGVTQLAQAVLSQTEDMKRLSESIVTLTKTVSERDQTIQALNNQLSSVQNRLIHLRDEETQKESYLKKIDDLAAQLLQLQSQLEQSKQRPWWKIW